MTSVAFAVQTHPARAELAAQLAAQLPGAQLAIDPDPRAHPSPWRTYRHALEQFSRGNGVSHLCVLQDDAEPCARFAEVAPRVAESRSPALVAFYVGGMPQASRDAVYAACERDEPYALLPRGAWVPAVALLWPVELIEPALAWVDEQRWPTEGKAAARFTADDEIIGRVMRALDVEVVATVPSLVEHPDVVPSIAGNRRRSMAGRNPDRVAACMIPDDCDALAIPW